MYIDITDFKSKIYVCFLKDNILGSVDNFPILILSNFPNKFSFLTIMSKLWDAVYEICISSDHPNLVYGSFGFQVTTEIPWNN